MKLIYEKVRLTLKNIAQLMPAMFFASVLGLIALQVIYLVKHRFHVIFADYVRPEFLSVLREYCLEYTLVITFEVIRSVALVILIFVVYKITLIKLGWIKKNNLVFLKQKQFIKCEHEELALTNLSAVFLWPRLIALCISWTSLILVLLVIYLWQSDFYMSLYALLSGLAVYVFGSLFCWSYLTYLIYNTMKSNTL